MSDRIEASLAQHAPANSGSAPADASNAASGADRAARRAYVAPKLVHLGSVRDLTLGGSGGHKTDVGTKFRVK